MRSFEFVEGSSAKFWEIERGGCDVTVRFGRVRARGQTSVKTLADEAAAAAHETKLINEKLRKGYVETAASTVTATVSATPAASAVPSPAASTAIASAPAVSAPVVSAPVVSAPVVSAPVVSGPVVSGPVDEDAFVFPTGWYRYRSARRGSAGIGRFVPGPKARSAVDTEIARNSDLIQRVLHAATTAESTCHVAKEWLNGSPGASPLGAAAIALIAESGRWDATDWANPFADVWIGEHGLRFAAESVVTLMALIIEDDYAPPYPRSTANDDPGVRHRKPHETRYAWMADRPMQTLLRVRHALASAPAEEYAEVLAALQPYRQAHCYVRTALSVLFPEQREWFEEDVANAVASNDAYLAVLLLTAASTKEDAERLYPVAESYTMIHSLNLLTTLVDGVGPAAATALFHWFDGAAGAAESQKRLLSVLAVLPGDQVTRGLIDRIDAKYVMPALVEHAERYPARALRLLAEAAGKRTVADLLRGHLLKHRSLAEQMLDQQSSAGHAVAGQTSTAQASVSQASVSQASAGQSDPGLGAEAAGLIRQILADVSEVAPAPLSAVPPVLADPPWKHAPTRAKPVVVSGLTCADPATVSWLPGERDQWRKVSIHRYSGETRWDPHLHLRSILDNHLSLREAVLFFTDAREEIARPGLASWRPDDAWLGGTYIRPVAGRFELDALPPLLALARRSPAEMATSLMPFSSPEIAALVADWLARLRSVRQDALDWLLRHPAEAARALIPPALGKAGTARRQAENALLALHTNGRTEAVRTAAQGYGDAAAVAVDALLVTDPLAILPTKIPVVPAWVSPGLLRPVRLRDGSGALPDEPAANLLTILALSRLDSPYPGLAPVREACEPSSLAAFVWSLFELWQASGSPSKDNWVLDALGLLGDDETVRRLSPLILAWPGEGGHTKAITGLGVLATIGSDVALMHLHNIAQRAKFTGLKTAARQKMDEVAATLGLTAEQLADRLVPDFGLESDGTMRLDYGARQFVVGFDEQLRPYVADTDGKRLKALPKPGVRDDATLAPAAYQRFAGLKKDVRTVAADQVRRLEHAMVTGRRWTGADFRRLFVEHPLLWHIVRRLVWVTFTPAASVSTAPAPTAAPARSFRVAEDRTFSTVDDEGTVLADDAVVGVAHPLHLGDDVAAWGEVFADYEILQPFPQLGRPILALTEEERKVSRLVRFQGVKVPTTRLLSLERRGWRRETPQDAGIQSRIEFAIEPGREMVIEIEPGIAIGYLDMNPEQELTGVFLHDGTCSRWGNDGERGHVALGNLDPVTVSELLRDLTDLTTS